MRPTILVLLLFAGTVSYGQSKTSPKTLSTNTNEQLLFDTSRISILPIDTSKKWLFKNAKPLQLSNQDLRSIDKILTARIQTHNIKQDTTKEFNEFIDLRKYKIQYIPFIGSDGQRKVYVNAFCNYTWDFELEWKKYLIEVNDGGSCFFQLIINLTKNKAESFSTNGYG